MTNPLPKDVRQMQEMALAHPDLEGLSNAFLLVLENVPDSSLIETALAPFDPQQFSSLEFRQRVCRILENCDNRELLLKWSNSSEQQPQGAGQDDLPAETASQSNVIAFGSAGHAAAEVKVTRPGLSFEHIGGLENVKAQVRRKIINPFLNKGLFQKYKRKAGGGVLMYGPPGCGKTMFARAVANECNARFVDVRAAEILDQYVGMAEKRIAQLFAETRASRPCVLFFDEVEALAQRRQFDSMSRINTTVSALLTEMDGFDGDNEGILFLGATNVPWSLDSAFRRPGRFDRTIFVPPPDKIARQFILRSLLKDRPVANGLDISLIVKETSGFSGADLSAVVETAIDYAIEESSDVEDIIPLNDGHFREALQEVRPSTGEWLAQARNFGEYANQDGLYDDLKKFLDKYGV